MSEGVVDRPKLYFYRPVTSGLLDWLAEDGQPSHVTIMTLGFATLARVHVYIRTPDRDTGSDLQPMRWVSLTTPSLIATPRHSLRGGRPPDS